MDVRCEKCATEYELDETRLKPGGVTVKCTSCGHLFKVRKRAITVVGVGSPTRNASPSGPHGVPGNPISSSPQNGSRARTQSGPLSSARPDTEPDAGPPMLDSSTIPRSYNGSGSGAVDSPRGSAGRERKWMIRLPTGEIETCRELATLQQWIVSGKVTRSSGISRTGKSWKQLGDIAELRSFFTIADEARQARKERSVAQPLPEPPPQPRIEPALDKARSPQPTPVAAPVAAPVHEASRAERLAAAAASPEALPTSGPGADSGRWAGKPARASRSELSGPTGGMARGIPTTDVAFARGKITQPPPMGPPGDELDEHDTPARGGVGRWIVLVSLLLMGGAAAVVYLLVFREPGPALSSQMSDAGMADGPLALADAAPADAAAQEQAVASGQAEAEAEILAAAEARILAADMAALEAAETELAGLPTPDNGQENIEVLVTRARLHTALAQHGMDEAATANDDKNRARELERQAQERVLDALTLVTRALKIDREHPGANTVMADVLRLQGKRSRDVEGYLKKALARDRKDREALLVQALLHIRENKERKARELLTELSTGKSAMEQTGDARPVYRLALMDMAAGTFEVASRRAEAMLAAAPEHELARALLARIRAATSVDTSDPLPPEEGSSGSDDGDDGDGDDGDDGDDDRGERSYDSLLARAHRKAENGDCREAMKLYERAIDINPIGVAALTGMGYCHIDRKEFASAHAKFKAALVVSSRYQDALWGIAEAYQQQGLKDRAVEGYQRFIDEHPQSSRAAMAKRQIEKLGGSSKPAPDPNTTGTTGNDSSGSGSGSSQGSQGTQGSSSGTGGSSGSSPGSSGDGSGDGSGDSAKPPPDKPEPAPAPAPAGDDGSDGQANP